MSIIGSSLASMAANSPDGKTGGAARSSANRAAALRAPRL
jgi:hypothetical protein